LLPPGEPTLLLAPSRRTHTFNFSLLENPHFYLVPLPQPRLLCAPSRRTHTFTCSLFENSHFYLLPLKKPNTFTCSVTKNPDLFLLPLGKPTLLLAPSRRTHTFTSARSLSENQNFYICSYFTFAPPLVTHTLTCSLLENPLLFIHSLSETLSRNPHLYFHSLTANPCLYLCCFLRTQQINLLPLFQPTFLLCFFL
jgi:hypothetical protein